MGGVSEVGLASGREGIPCCGESPLPEEDRAQLLKMRSMGQLAAGIAHEINTPVQYVGDNIHFLKDAFETIAGLLRTGGDLLAAAREGRAGAEQVRQFEAECERADLGFLMTEVPGAIQHALDGVERISRIVRAFKEFAHPGPAEKAPTDLNASIETTLTVARNQWKYVADLVTDFDPSLPPVLCHPAEINQVILNMVVNAVHAITDAIAQGRLIRGVITVATQLRDGWAEIRIADDGAGIPESIRQRIFDPFFTTKAIGRGTGQGLAICHAVIVQKHGGRITVESEVGHGSVFTLSLPLSEGVGRP
jgi:signal transduction histidine kinase